MRIKCIPATCVAITMCNSFAFAQTSAPGDAPPEIPDLTISTDRPSFSDGTGIVPLGHLNLETGYTFTFRDRDGVEIERHNGLEILARYGLFEDRFELRAIWSGYIHSRSESDSGSDTVDGLSDLALGFKLKLTDQDGWMPRLALGAQTTLGGGSEDVSTQEAEPTLKLLWSYDLSQAFDKDWSGLTLGGNVNVAFPTSGGEHFTQDQYSVYLSFPLFDRTSGFVEYFVIDPNSQGSDAAHYIDFGATHLLNNRVQLDGRVGFGLNNEADNVFVGFGVSFLF
jgi:hypothetical protein